MKNWKHRVFVRGNQLLDNIEFEEWSLKGLDKDLGPELWPLKTEGSKSPDPSVAQQQDPKRQGVVSVPDLPTRFRIKLSYADHVFLVCRYSFCILPSIWTKSSCDRTWSTFSLSANLFTENGSTGT